MGLSASFNGTLLEKVMEVNMQVLRGCGSETGKRRLSLALLAFFASIIFASAVFAAPPSLIVTTPSLPAARAGQSYSVPLNVSGGTPAYAFVVSGLPEGLHFNGTTIWGVPTRDGTFNVTIIATDKAFKSARKSFPLVVTKCSPTSG